MLETFDLGCCQVALMDTPRALQAQSTALKKSRFTNTSTKATHSKSKSSKSKTLKKSILNSPRFVTTPQGALSLKYRCNFVNLRQVSPQYIFRLAKYAGRGVAVGLQLPMRSPQYGGLGLRLDKLAVRDERRRGRALALELMARELLGVSGVTS